MKTGIVVIGANYGDEGKGVITDYFINKYSESSSVVVRFNGGAQAGHTVVLPDGRRHIFSHFGAGTLSGSSTYLSKFFIVNPILFLKELAQLKSLGANDPEVTISSDAMVTTPFDMFINQIVERRRGISRHGSCGLGINETVTRSHLSPEHRVSAAELREPNSLRRKLNFLGKNWFLNRLKEHHIDETTIEVSTFVANLPAIIERYIADIETMLVSSNIASTLPQADRIIFEGAQGLMLDEDRIQINAPRLTRSKTGLDNVVLLAEKFEIERLEVTYVSRTYLTRHGAGPLVGECDWSLVDRTNVTNQFQGQLRFAPLNCRELCNSIRLDLARAKRRFSNITANIAMTCADQIHPPDRSTLPLPLAYVSYGPGRSDVGAESPDIRLRVSSSYGMQTFSGKVQRDAPAK